MEASGDFLNIKKLYLLYKKPIKQYITTMKNNTLSKNKILAYASSEMLEQLEINIKPIKWWNFIQKMINKENLEIQELINDIYIIAEKILNTPENKNKITKLSLNLLTMETLYENEVAELLYDDNNSGLETKVKKLEMAENVFKEFSNNSKNIKNIIQIINSSSNENFNNNNWLTSISRHI